MDAKKQRRNEYKRNWIAATRSLRQTTSIGNTETDDIDNQSDTYHNSDEDTLGEHQPTSEMTQHTSYTNTSVYGIDTDNLANEDMIFDWYPTDQAITLSDSESESELETNSDILAADLSQWANENSVMHNTMDSLLKILRKHGHSSLPSTTRTLLRTVREVETEMKSGMEYFYFGLEKQLLVNFKLYPEEIQKDMLIINISFNIDGLPLFKSNSTSLWPVLCSIDVKPVKVFPVAITLGKTKPSNLEFLKDTIQEIDRLVQNGLVVNQRIIRVNLKCIICDAPAKAFVKGIKLYSGYYGCDRCSQRGEWVGRMTYQDVHNLDIRTDQTFRNFSNDEHHHYLSPFCDLSIDMVKQFPIDYMHQVCLGVMKRLLLIWKRGKRGVKMSANQIDEVSRNLVRLRTFITSAFARKPRGLEEIDRWKATEFRQFLLYTGKIVLKDVLQPDMYKNFMAFSVGISILVSPSLVQKYLEYAHGLLVYFVEGGRQLYGPEFLVYNVHSMLHLAEDVGRYGSLDGCSAFVFENYLQRLKKMVRSGRNPLVQIVKRLDELEKFQHVTELKHTVIKTKPPNNCYIIDSKICCEVVAQTTNNDLNHAKDMILCRVYERPEPMFNHPCDSRLIGVYRIRRRNARMKLISSDHLQSSAMMIDLGQGAPVIFLSILHEF